MKEQQNTKLAKVYWKQSSADLSMAESALSKGDLKKSSLLANQSVNNALASICISKNKYQLPSYSLVELLKICKNFDEQFAELEDLCLSLDAIQEIPLFESRKNSGATIPLKEVQLTVKKSKQLRKSIRKLIKKNNFFSLTLLT